MKVKTHLINLLAGLACSLSLTCTQASEVDFMPVWNWPVNSNFVQAESAINDNDLRIAEMEATIQELSNLVQSLQDQVASLENGGVPGLDEYVSVETDSFGRPAVIFDGVNVHLRKGNESNTPNGLGNLIIGYDRTAEEQMGTALDPHCSNGYQHAVLSNGGVLPTQETCEAGGNVWSNLHKSGSHNLVMGNGHNYSGESNIVSGFGNAVAEDFNIVTGSFNFGGYSTFIFGGIENNAYFGGSILGGHQNTASGLNGQIVGGYENTADGWDSVVIGGSYNTAHAFVSTVTGGLNREAFDTDDTVLGSITEDN